MTNDDLISRDALKKVIEEDACEEIYYPTERILALIDNAPSQMIKLAEGINERLINEYISKVECCDECFASIYCTVNDLRESRVPQDYCVKNIKSYFDNKAKPVEERPQGKWVKEDIEFTFDNFQSVYRCSKCCKRFYQKFNFCPNCGADMRGEKK